MSIQIGQKIKYFREKMGITQECLAEKLNISPQAVSKWETNSACPDIALIPILADCFHVSCDALLTDDAKTQEEIIGDILAAAGQQETDSREGYFRKVALLEDGLERYPRSCRLMLELAYTYSVGAEYPEFKQRDWLKKSIAYGERVYAHSEKLHEKHAAVQLLCYLYRGIDNERILELASQMPEICQSRPALIYHGYSDDRFCEGMYAYFSELLETAQAVMSVFVPGRGHDVDELFQKIHRTAEDRSLWRDRYHK